MTFSEDERNRVALEIVRSLLWTPYRWGGDDPMDGVDCSGAMVEACKSVGVISPSEDYTAQGLFELLVSRVDGFEVPGDMVFWQGSSGKVVHVEMVFNSDLELSIGASGGGSSTLSVADASRDNAYVKIRPYRGRSRKIAGFRKLERRTGR